MEQSNEKSKPCRRTTGHFSHSLRELQQRVAKLIHSFSLINPDQAVIIGVSGGSDSVALLHLISTLFPATLRIAVYVDHGLRPSETAAEKQLVQERAIACSAIFRAVSVNVTDRSKREHISTEEAARILRYQALEKVQEEFQAGCIAVGHTANDQAEEVLLRLIRGSGSTGLSGMDLQRGTIIRPLLREKKYSLSNYLKEQGIPFCQDSSNLDPRFLRNRIRLDLLPKLENEYNRAMSQTLIQTASILKEEDRLLQDLTQKAYLDQVRKELVESSATPGKTRLFLDLALFTREHPALQRRLLEKICWSMNSRPSFQKIENLLSLATSQDNGEIHLSCGLRASRQDSTIIFHHPVGKKAYRGPAIIKKSFSPLPIPGPGSYPVPELGHELLIEKVFFTADALPHEQLFIDPSKLRFPLLLRPSLPGDLFHPLGAPGRKKISRFLSDQKIPADMRDNYPLLLSEDKIVAVAGLRLDHHFQISTTGMPALRLQWRPIDVEKPPSS
ncbi:MAG: tRNA lysidine(34) synthetase TilS [Proteobacteria bacterium]|nr:tRNA lysidine(34) synthetase TilS [Pseudomonadota bacterium]MBU1417344.1 tRNA lysidine(34) synthetase TilS [Pseudomonadota bacterium]MBU1455297.1 tRNA lysidine(34) synthetase TilS [Pseudomonadota bacterium]